MLGNISYSSYLLHFPLQLLVYAVVMQLGTDQSVFYASWAMCAYFAILIGLSLASFHCFELPLQKWLRQRALSHCGR